MISLLSCSGMMFAFAFLFLKKLLAKKQKEAEVGKEKNFTANQT